MGPRNGGLWWTGPKNTHSSDPGWPANDLCPFIGGWEPRVMTTLTGWARQAQPCLGGVPVVCEYVHVPHRTVSPCLTACDPHSSRPHFFKSGHTAWHGTKESTWYLARNYHEPSTVPARKRATGPSQPEPGICTVPSVLSMFSSKQACCTGYSDPALALARRCGEGGLIARTTHSLTHCTGLDCWLVGHWPSLPYPLGRPALLMPACPPSELRVVFPSVWICKCFGRRRVSGFIIYMDMCAHTRCSCRPAPTFHNHQHKGPSFLDRPILPSEKPVTLCVSKDKQSHRLVGTSETFYESHSPQFSSTVSAAVAHTHIPPSSLSLVCSVLRSFLLCVFFFKRCATSLPDIELPSSSIASRLPLGSPGTNITARLKRKQQYHEIHGSPPHPISTTGQPASDSERVCSPHCLRPPFTQPLPTAQRSATTPIKGRSAGLLLPVGRLT